MKFLTEIAACTLATVLIGLFSLNFKTASERVEILHRVTGVTRPITQLLGMTSVAQYR